MWFFRWGREANPQTVLRRLLNRIEISRKGYQKSLVRLEKKEALLFKRMEELKKDLAEVRLEASDLKRSAAMFTSNLEAAEEALKTAHEITIPGLVSALDTFRQTWDAQSAQAALRSAVMSSRDE
jgi:predicted  nucleic acid-binding Zn-ribbon protein